MPPLSLFLRATAAAVVGNAVTSTQYAQCAPAFSSSVFGAPDARTLDALGSIRLQDQDIPWEIESDDFHRGYDANKTQLQILRLRAEYVDSTGAKSPVMRVVGFFPGVPTSTVYEYLTNVTLRRGWDCNYTHFEQFAGNCPSTLPDSEMLRRPLATVAKKFYQCCGDECTLIPDVADVMLDHGWFCHRVGGSVLRRFGLADRLFQYERLSYAYGFRESAADMSGGVGISTKMYDIIFSGSKRAREEASAAAPSLSDWIQANREAVPCEEVDMNFQHVVLVPIAEAKAQLFCNSDQLRQLCTMGSMLDVRSTKLVYDVWKDTQSRTTRGTALLPGTLLIITSASNVGIPPLLPRWAQKTIMGTISRKAYDHLLTACLEDGSGEVTK
ncbi:hypothetical protein Q4I28_000783 [Leishmania naiffi]|uniref:Uncharacterized protein n=1 Tax=Leishmania naiffi TaxID=5678 RepID=A0AAW3C818_9TRYP